MALQNSTFSTLSFYQMLSGWREGRAFLFSICILQDTAFSLDPSGFLLLVCLLPVIALSLFVGNREMEGCYADIKGLQLHAGKHESKRDF